MSSEKQSPTHSFIEGDCLTVMKQMADDSVDLIVASPPYEDCRDYGIGFKLTGQDYVDWCVERYLECVRVCSGLVVWVVEGKTKRFRWSATPALIMADLHRAGVKLRKPPAYKRVGIPGSGGPDWLRNDYELCICSSKGKLPWSDNTAFGDAPKYKPGGRPSHRNKDGSRVQGNYKPPTKCNPGNVIDLGAAGGGSLGHPLAHDNEAPFKLDLAKFFVGSFCKPGGIAMDCFAGSGTVAHAARDLGRSSISIDIRPDQVRLAKLRNGITSEPPTAEGSNGICHQLSS